MLRKLSIILFIFLLPATLFAAFPKPAGFVNDFAGVIDPDLQGNLENFLAAFEKSTGVQVAIATLGSLGGRAVEDVAVELFKEWGVGKKGKDDGVLFLVAPADRKMRIEVGYGLEGAINDALAGRILDEAVLPLFRQDRMGEGIAAGAVAIVSAIVAGENLSFDVNAALAELPASSLPSADEGGPLSVAIKILVLIAMIILFIRYPWLFLFLVSTSRRGGGSGSGGGGFGGGGFGGFGGGMSGGGGASRGW